MQRPSSQQVVTQCGNASTRDEERSAPAAVAKAKERKTSFLRMVELLEVVTGHYGQFRSQGRPGHETQQMVVEPGQQPRWQPLLASAFGVETAAPAART